MSFIDEQGYHRTSLADRIAMLKSEMRAIFGTDLEIADDSPEGQELAVFAAALDDIDQRLEQIYSAQSPGMAAGAHLARIVGINGVIKKEPGHATAELTFTGGPGAVVPAGSLVASSVDPTVLFGTDMDAKIVGSTVTVSATATVTGAFATAAIAAHALTVMKTVLNGVTSVDNASGAVNGNAGETDDMLRARRAASMALPSQGIVDGLEGALLQLPDVEQAIVRENPEDTTQVLADGGSLAPHAIQCIVRGGDDTEIAEAIARRRALGCTMVGATVVQVKDAQGTLRDIKFDRATEVLVYVTVHTLSPLSTNDQNAIAQAIEDRGNGKLFLGGVSLPGAEVGEDVSVSDVFEAISYLSVTSMPDLKVSRIAIGTTATPTTTAPVAIAFSEIAAWAASRVAFASP